MGYIDSHAHLGAKELYPDVADIIGAFTANDIERVMIICCDDSDYHKALGLQENYGYFDLAKGIHPEDTNTCDSDDLAILEYQLGQGKIVMIWEIGLDYYWIKDNKEKQQQLFIRQLEMADRYDLPVAIHSREAANDTYEILRRHHRSHRGVMHCYSGSIEMMERYIELGYFISFAGPVTFDNARGLKEVAQRTPLSCLLYETDCPYLTPVPFRGKRNDPNYVVYTAKKLAELQGLSVESLNRQVKCNYQRLLGRHVEV